MAIYKVYQCLGLDFFPQCLVDCIGVHMAWKPPRPLNSNQTNKCLMIQLISSSALDDVYSLDIMFIKVF